MNIQDVVIAMDDMMISIPEIIEYTKHIEPLPFAHKKSIPKYPGTFAGIVISENIQYYFLNPKLTPKLFTRFYNTE